MAKMKVSILDVRRRIPELNCFSPVYNVEVEDKRLTSIIRAGFTVVDAADLTKIYVDVDGVTPKKMVKASSGSAGGSAPTPPSGSSTPPSGGGA